MSTARREALPPGLAEATLLKLNPKDRWVPTAAAADRTAQRCCSRLAATAHLPLCCRYRRRRSITHRFFAGARELLHVCYAGPLWRQCAAPATALCACNSAAFTCACLPTHTGQRALNPPASCCRLLPASRLPQGNMLSRVTARVSMRFLRPSPAGMSRLEELN
jgi:hypothetical protein